jgi:hypothetical protein
MPTNGSREQTLRPPGLKTAEKSGFGTLGKKVPVPSELIAPPGDHPFQLTIHFLMKACQ